MRDKTITLAASTDAYTAGDTVGTKVDFGQVIGEIRTIVVTDNSNQGVAGNILLFEGNPASATVTDNAAFAWGTGAPDLAKLVGIIAVPTYITVASEKAATAANVGLGVNTNNLYAVLVTTGTPTLVAATDVSIRISWEPKRTTNP